MNAEDGPHRAINGNLPIGWAMMNCAPRVDWGSVGWSSFVQEFQLVFSMVPKFLITEL